MGGAILAPMGGTDQPTKTMYEYWCTRRFGRSNPERIQNSVWEWMAREKHTPFAARELLELESSVYRSSDEPDWCFQRMGSARVRMPDGRLITIAGEHEDCYDPDFCIFNDIVVEQGDDIEIYGYPRDLFPPTDFHSATLDGEMIWLIGSIGYQDERAPGATQVFRLDTRTFELERVMCRGESPGWISRHKAEYLEEEGVIRITDGEVMVEREGKESTRDNLETYDLELETATWHRRSHRDRWRQFALRYDVMARTTRESMDDWRSSLGWHTGEILLELGYPCELHEFPEVDEASDEDDTDEDDACDVPVSFLTVDGVRVSCSDRFGQIHVVIQGTLPDSTVNELLTKLKDLAASTQREIQSVDELS